MNIRELAAALHISSAIVTRHIRMLEKAGIISTENMPGKRGTQKRCTLKAGEVTLVFEKEAPPENYQVISLPVGHYMDCRVMAPCGLAAADNYIGLCDDARYFSAPEHVQASLLWFRSGWVTYRIPGYMLTHRPLHAIEISMEISSLPRSRTDGQDSATIQFRLNEQWVGTWVCAPCHDGKKGRYTPPWWRNEHRCGMLKTIRITEQETLLDGLSLSAMTLRRLAIRPGQDLFLQIAVPEQDHPGGGACLFGRGFGNYDQDIEVRVIYTPSV